MKRGGEEIYIGPLGHNSSKLIEYFEVRKKSTLSTQWTRRGGAVRRGGRRTARRTRRGGAVRRGGLVIIDFTASWCGPCRFIAPVFAEYAKKFPGATFLKVDVDELKEVAEKYSVQAMPTFLLIKDGETVDTVVGARKEELQSNIAKHIAA